MKRVDARGLSCPEPVIQTKNAMASREAQYEVLVDNVVAKENVSRFAIHQGYQVEVEGEFPERNEEVEQIVRIKDSGYVRIYHADEE